MVALVAVTLALHTLTQPLDVTQMRVHNVSDAAVGVWVDGAFAGQVASKTSSRVSIPKQTENDGRTRVVTCAALAGSPAIAAFVLEAPGKAVHDLVWGDLVVPAAADLLPPSSDPPNAATIGLVEQFTLNFVKPRNGGPTRFASTMVGTVWNGQQIGQSILLVRPPGKPARCLISGILFIEVRPSGAAKKDANSGVPDPSVYFLAATETTRAQYAHLTGGEPPSAADSELPAVGMTWQEAIDSASRLPIGTGWRASLPTELQWETACRAGTGNAFSPAHINVDHVLWYNRNSDGVLHRVATKQANEWGFFDLHGNVREWCRDWWSARPPSASLPLGPQAGTERVRRGGAFDTPLEWCACGYRDASPPDIAQPWCGFRIVIERK